MRAHLLDVVQRGDDGAAFFVPAFDEEDEVGGGRGGGGADRLVGKDEATVLQQQAGDQHALELSTGERADRAIGEIENAERGERMGDLVLGALIETAPDADRAPWPHGGAVEYRDWERAVDVDLLRKVSDVAVGHAEEVDRSVK